MRQVRALACLVLVGVASVASAAPKGKVPAPDSTSVLLQRAKSLFESLEYADVIPLSEEILKRGDTTLDMRLDAYTLQGSALAIVGNPVDAEKPFRFLLRGRPDYEMPVNTPPKIMAVFRKVQVEERAIADQMRELRRSRIVKELQLEGRVPPEAPGGAPLQFNYKLRDPGRNVSQLSVHYRKGPQQPFSTLALQADDSGKWRAEIPGEWTANDSGFVLEYYVSSKDTDGYDLLKVGDANLPLRVAVSPGTVADARPFYKSPWFWAAVGAGALTLGVGGWVMYDRATQLPDADGRIDLP